MKTLQVDVACCLKLFTIFLSDIVDCLTHSKALLFADDLKIFKEIDTPADQMLLQKDVDCLHNWSVLSKLDFNIGTCKQMSICGRPKENVL